MQELKVGAGRFVVGAKAIQNLKREMQYFGKKALIIGGPSSVDKVAECVDLNELGIVHRHTGECSKRWAEDYSEIVKQEQCDLIIGMGGGKCIDLAKCAATYANCPIITVPTSVATCAASSAVCIMYTDEGRSDGSVGMNREVDVVLADSEIIKNSPKRLWGAGLVDSLAKLPEVIHNLTIKNHKDCDLNKYICYINGKAIWEFIMGEGYVLADDQKDLGLVENMIVTNLIHTSIVSGFSSGSGQLALAHGLYDFIRREFVKEAKDILHGEIVGVGLIMQMYYNGDDPQEIENLKSFMEHFGMPMNLRDIHYEDTDDNRRKLIEYLTKSTNVTDVERLEKALEKIK
ncbi:MAG: iron-containing alcohol dehydrogenase [Faecalicatena sp.]|uniref:iron-containing alcohol dehydrogenase n=1 Tax=Faecalicatena sp. TaxID=2005360 RepID=UPI0025893B1C|nr:iron-containing alcohol dehydrogenase [Faecalicatena sp.]MCI6467141.1 iron-containing alcohol dehydrogenase [Faecalicatena sp.]MDY5618925.1 iron-containing alcohol dehydrogenase [Lachnospiraceae bacterium]